MSTANAIQSLRAPMGRGDHRRHARPRRHLGCRHLRCHPAASPHGAGAPGQALQLGGHLLHLFDERRPLVEPGIGGEQPGGVGEQHEQVGVHQVGHQCAEPVVVTETDLVVGHRIVLVHHGHHTQLQQAEQGGPGVEVLLAHPEVERCEEHLAGHHTVAREGVVVDPHEPALTNGRHRLQGDGVDRTLVATQADGRQPGGDGAGRDHHHLVASGAHGGHLGTEGCHRIGLHVAVLVGDRRRPDLGHHERHESTLPGQASA
jgi:hypothetical protein